MVFAAQVMHKLVSHAHWTAQKLAEMATMKWCSFEAMLTDGKQSHIMLSRNVATLCRATQRDILNKSQITRVSESSSPLPLQRPKASPRLLEPCLAFTNVDRPPTCPTCCGCP